MAESRVKHKVGILDGSTVWKNTLQLPQQHWQVPQRRDSNGAHPALLVSSTAHQNMHCTQDNRNLVRQLPSGLQS